MSGQTLTDRIAAAQYTLTGSEVCRAVCKATTHEQTAPKKKHLECKYECPSILYPNPSTFSTSYSSVPSGSHAPPVDTMHATHSPLCVCVCVSSRECV